MARAFGQFASMGAVMAAMLAAGTTPRITGNDAIKMHLRRQGRTLVKPSGYSGQTLRRLNAERGVGRPPSVLAKRRAMA